MKCYKIALKAKHVLEEREKLESMYTDVRGPTQNMHGQRQWTFIHECGTEQTWSFFNILKRLKDDPKHVPCSKCGGIRRTKAWVAGYIAKFGITEDQIRDFARYKRKVYGLSDVVYLANQAELNPNGYARGRHTWHLDHIIPVVHGFKEGWPPEKLAVKENLRLIPAKENLSKGRRILQCTSSQVRL